MRLRRVVAGTAAVATVACGAGAVPAAGADNFTAQANAICQRSLVDLRALGEPSADHIAGYMRKTLVVATRQYREIGRLHPPSSKRRAVRRALALARPQIKIVREAIRALDAGKDPQAVVRRMGRRLDPLSAREDRLWRQVGADRCTFDSSGETTYQPAA